LAERFETSRFIGKRLLAGKDVSGNFLQSRGAHVLKALVGDDQLSGELKNLNAAPAILGQFDVAITCNSHLRVKLDGDAEAWRRRLLIVSYERPKPEVRIARFAEELLEPKARGSCGSAWRVPGCTCVNSRKSQTFTSPQSKTHALMRFWLRAIHYAVSRARESIGALIATLFRQRRS
jgi:hypothetical protein